jgi:DNA-binding response OmpR family regulator
MPCAIASQLESTVKHVLLFEDGHDIAIGLRRTLEDNGYHVSVTAKLNDACQMLERVKFDLIIASIHLPDGTAFEVMEMAKQRGIRTFLMTGSSSPVEPIARSGGQDWQ